MKTTTLIVLLLLAACLLSVPGTWAETKGYFDSGQNSQTGFGVVGAEYTGSKDFGSAIYGHASGSSETTYGGHFVSDSPDGKGVYGFATADSGRNSGGLFITESSDGSGITAWAQGVSGLNYGGFFLTNSTGGMAVYGESLATTGYTYGGHFKSNSETGTAVHGEAKATSDRVTYGGHFESASTKGIGVYGLAKSKTGKTYGGHFLSDSSEGGTAVYGAARALEGTTYGGYFRTYSSNGSAVYGWARKDKAGDSGTGGEFISDGELGVGVNGLASATSGKTWGGHFQSKSPEGIGVFGQASSVKGVNYGVYGGTSSPDGYGVFSAGNMKVSGSLKCTGTKSAVVNLKNGEGVTLYAVEASENWFEDFGSAKLKDGSAVVAIDPLYSETVNTKIDYHVFLTPRGECKGLYVINQKGSSFEVRELNGGKSDIPFSYRIVAKRKGYEDVRLAKVKEEMMTAMVGAEGDGQKDEASGRLRKVK